MNVHSRNLAVPFWLTAPLIYPLRFFNQRGEKTEDMSAPAWAIAPSQSKRDNAESSKGSIPPWTRGDKSTPGGSSKCDEGKSRSRATSREVRQSTVDSRETTERPDSGKRVKLGRTHGILAVGAWAAREEIASLLEDGHPAEDIIRAIRSGEELGPSLRKESEVETAPGKPFTSSGSVRSERSSLSADAPKWSQKAPSFSYSFRKRADLRRRRNPKWVASILPSDQSMNEVMVDEVETPFFAPQKEELKELTGGFRKKAAAPKRVAEFKELRSELARYVPKSLPRRANPSEQKKLDDYIMTPGPKLSMRVWWWRTSAWTGRTMRSSSFIPNQGRDAQDADTRESHAVCFGFLFGDPGVRRTRVKVAEV